VMRRDVAPDPRMSRQPFFLTECFLRHGRHGPRVWPSHGDQARLRA
jgi:hypothetical protein